MRTRTKCRAAPRPALRILRAQVNRIEVYLGKLDQTQPQAVSQQNNVPKDARIEALMLFLKEKFGNDATTAALDRIAKQLEGLKSEGQMGNNLGGTKLSRGMIIVNLPSDATLYVNELESKPGSNVRSFISPDLEKGKAYFYTLRVELKRNDRVLTETQKITFQPGNEVVVSFNHLDRVEWAVAYASARIMLPEDGSHGHSKRKRRLPV